MLRIRRSSAAERDLIAIWLHVADDDPDAADRVLDLINSRLDTLAQSPDLGHTCEDLYPGARCFVVFQASWRSRFLVFYRIADDAIEIARVLESHQSIARDWFPE